MPRTTLDLDDVVLRELKRRRAREHRPLGAIASELLARALAEEPQPSTPFAWEARAMGAKVDLDDKDAVWAALDEVGGH
jgi:plasmid stability protein